MTTTPNSTVIGRMTPGGRMLLAFLLVGLVIAAVALLPRGSNGLTGTAKVDSEICTAALNARVATLPFVVTKGEAQTYYNYCVDLREGRTPTARPNF